MNNIYRVRPANEYTIDELKNSYLWFSRPKGFKGDIDDANICAFFLIYGFQDPRALKGILTMPISVLSLIIQKLLNVVLNFLFPIFHTKNFLNE